MNFFNIIATKDNVPILLTMFKMTNGRAKSTAKVAITLAVLVKALVKISVNLVARMEFVGRLITVSHP
jgi:hypothetical protein